MISERALIFLPLRLLIAVYCGTVLIPNASAQTSMVEEIVQQPIFQHRLIYVGDRMPDEQETRDLGLAIKLLYSDGVATGIAAFEEFIAAHPDSAWTPSLRSNLGYHYRKMGRYSLAAL